jgi:CDP-glucose 4,6-dehydratase
LGRRDRALEDLVSKLKTAYSGKRVLVTGHNGFKGTWLVALLKSLGAEVYGLSLQIESNSPFKVFHASGNHNSIIQDICDFPGLTRVINQINPEVVFHLAAQSLVLDSYEKPLETFRVNVIGTANLLEATLNKSCKGIVVVTTDKVYKNDNEGLTFKETDILWGHDPYSLSKTGTELVVSAWRSLPTIGKRQIVSVRAGNVFGPGDRANNRLLPDLVIGLKTGQETIIRNPESIRPWQFVLDPLMGYLIVGMRILSEQELCEAYNFGPDEKSFISVHELVEIFRKIAPLPIKLINDEKGLEAKILKLDSSLAISDLGWIPVTTLSQGIEISLEIEDDEISAEAIRSFIANYLLNFTKSSV